MDKIKNQEKYWDEVAEEKKFPTPFQIKEFEKYVSPGKSILDVGCGYGRTLSELYNHRFKDLTGVDFSHGMINRGLKLHPQLNLLKNDGDKLPFSDDKFDAVLLIAVLTCTANPQKQDNLIAEISRVLKKDGILYINDYLINDDQRNVERYQKYREKYGTYGVFELPEGAVLRHHTPEYILNLTKDYKELIFKKTIYNTMNGNKSNGFYYIGQLKNKD
jgi:ubiquinone/menaquinone biosynthesis C-methylase UbiE